MYNINEIMVINDTFHVYFKFSIAKSEINNDSLQSEINRQGRIILSAVQKISNAVVFIDEELQVN